MGRRATDKKKGNKLSHLVRRHIECIRLTRCLYHVRLLQFGRSRKSSTNIKQPEYETVGPETYRRKLIPCMCMRLASK